MTLIISPMIESSPIYLNSVRYNGRTRTFIPPVVYRNNLRPIAHYNLACNLIGTYRYWDGMMGLKSIVRMISFWTALGLILGAFLILVSGSSVADDLGDFDYQLIDSGAHVEIAGYHGLSRDVDIPAFIDGLPVTSIGESAFDGRVLTLNLTSVKIPATVTNIGDSAFYSNGALISMTIPQNVTSIGPNVFFNCSAMTSIIFEGNSPSVGPNWISNHNISMTIYFYDEASGFSTPTWQEVSCIRLCRLVMDTNIGSTSPANGSSWAGSSVTITAIPPEAAEGERYIFEGWVGSGNGSYSGSNNPATVEMNGSIVETAFWTKQYQLTISTNHGSTDPGAGVYWHDEGSAVILQATAPLTVGDERYVWNGWTGFGSYSYTGSNNMASITMNGPIREMASWTHQYKVSFAASPSEAGSTQPSDVQWMEAGPLEIGAIPSGNYVFSSWTSDSSSITFVDQLASTFANIGAYGTVTANFISNNVEVTITSNTAGTGYVLVDGNATIIPWTFNWVRGSSHSLAAATDVTVGQGDRYRFSSWSDGQPQNHSFVVPTLATTVSASFLHQYQLTMASNFGNTTPTIGVHWIDAGSTVTLDSIAPISVAGERYVSFAWTGSGPGNYSGATNSASVTMNAPITQTASWTHQFQLTISSNFGTVSPSTGTWYNAGATVTLATAAPTSITGERYQFSSWAGIGVGSYSGTNNPATNAVTMNSPITEIAIWVHQYKLTIATNFGSVNPTAASWYDVGSVVPITANHPTTASGERYVSLTWTGLGTGSYTGTDNPATVTVNGPVTETAEWTHQYQVSFAVTPAGGGSINPTGDNVWVTAGSLSITATPSVNYAYSSWTSSTAAITFSAMSPSTAASINGPGTITAHFVLALGITITSNPTGSGYVLVDGNAITTPQTFNWVSGTHTIQAISVFAGGTDEQFVFNSWSDGKPQTHTYTVTALTATITANFDHQFRLNMGTNVGTTSPSVEAIDTWHNAGSTVTINASAPLVVTSNERYFWNGWTGTGIGSYTGAMNVVDVTMDEPITQIAVWSHQYLLTLATDIGTTTPSGSIWIDSATPVEISAIAPPASPGDRYEFAGWVGTGAGSYSGTAITVVLAAGGPITETPSWILQHVPGEPIGLAVLAGDGKVTLNWTPPASDGGVAIDHYIVYQDGVEVTIVGALTATMSGLTDGVQYKFTVAAHNPVGNGPSSMEMTVAPFKAPSTLTLEMTSPSNGSFIKSSSVMLEWAVSDPNSNVIKIEVSLDGMAWIETAGTEIRLDSLSDGPHTAYVRAADEAGYENSTSITFVVDVTAPDANITSPSSGAFVNVHSILAYWITSDVTSGVARVELSTDGTTWAIQSGNGIQLIMPEGSCHVYIKVTDKAGNTRTVSVAFTVDTLGPSIISNAPNFNDVSIRASVVVTFSEAMDMTASMITVDGINGTISWNGNEIVFTPVSVLFGWTSYLVTVDARDLAGNAVSDTWTFKTDPVGSLSGTVYGHDGKVLANATVNLKGQFASAQTAMEHLALSIPAIADVVLTTTTDANGVYTFYDVAIGNYTLEVAETGYGIQSVTVAMTLDAVQKGGLMVDHTVRPERWNDNGLFIYSIILLVVAVLTLGFIVRRRQSPNAAWPKPKEMKSSTMVKKNSGEKEFGADPPLKHLDLTAVKEETESNKGQSQFQATAGPEINIVENIEEVKAQAQSDASPEVFIARTAPAQPLPVADPLPSEVMKAEDTKPSVRPKYYIDPDAAREGWGPTMINGRARFPEAAGPELITGNKTEDAKPQDHSSANEGHRVVMMKKGWVSWHDLDDPNSFPGGKSEDAKPQDHSSAKDGLKVVMKKRGRVPYRAVNESDADMTAGAAKPQDHSSANDGLKVVMMKRGQIPNHSFDDTESLAPQADAYPELVRKRAEGNGISIEKQTDAVPDLPRERNAKEKEPRTSIHTAIDPAPVVKNSDERDASDQQSSLDDLERILSATTDLNDSSDKISSVIHPEPVKPKRITKVKKTSALEKKEPKVKAEGKGKVRVQRKSPSKTKKK